MISSSCLACVAVALVALLCAPLPSVAQPSTYSGDKKWLIYPPAPYTYGGEPSESAVTEGT